MSDIKLILAVIEKIKNNCNEMDRLKNRFLSDSDNEEDYVNKKKTELIKNMDDQLKQYLKNNFYDIKNSLKNLLEKLSEDYYDVIAENTRNVTEEKISSMPLNKKRERLNELIGLINNEVEKLNKYNFNKEYPPIKLEVNGETFVTYSEDNPKQKTKYDYNSEKRGKVEYPKPLEQIVKRIAKLSYNADECIDYIVEEYTKEFNIGSFNTFVQNSASLWIKENKAKTQNSIDQEYDKLFINEDAKAVKKSFFEDIENESRKTIINDNDVSNTYNEIINIGDLLMTVDEKKEHLNYFDNSPTLRKYLKDGKLTSPVLLNLKKNGNIIINTNESTFSPLIIDFVNQIIMSFLLSFPPKRINFSLVDIDNKLNLSKYKILTKIDTSILLNGIIRDDRQLENVIKDMEQTMYKIDDDILSYNGVSDIFEYNSKFEANPQNIYLFVIANYPNGYSADLAKRVLKIMTNGNKTGIFTLLINNKNEFVSNNYNFSAEDYNKYLAEMYKCSLVIDEISGKLKLKDIGKYPHSFAPRNNLKIEKLPTIVDLIKDNAETTQQKVVALEKMFEYIDKEKNTKSFSEVLKIPLGVRGGEILELELDTTGKGSPHAVIIGGTGSGKSNLLHTLILSACYRYGPDELNLYIVDFKGGVEFEFYENISNRIPHIKLTGLTSDIEDGVSIIENLKNELRRRENEFRQNKVEDIVNYCSRLNKKLPRILVIIDEIQELFERNEKLSKKAIDLLSELFKKGRAFGINILWASQNIPSVSGLKDKVLSQIGNHISLKLNNPDDAMAINISPKAVKALNRPEKGLGLINDMIHGNDSIEFRIAYAQDTNYRPEYTSMISKKWKNVKGIYASKPLFIVGDDNKSSPVLGETLYNQKISKLYANSLKSYRLQLGENYISGEPYNIEILLKETKNNVLFLGQDVEVLRDMMGYALFSTIIEQYANSDQKDKENLIYCANGEMIDSTNSEDLFNLLRNNDFTSCVENISSNDSFLECIKKVYITYKNRSIEATKVEMDMKNPPTFVFIHSMQKYIDLFIDDPYLQIKEEDKEKGPTFESSSSAFERASSLFSTANSTISTPKKNTMASNTMPDMIQLNKAMNELLDRGGRYGIHFVISIDNPFAFTGIKSALSESAYKVFIKGVNKNVIDQYLDEFNASENLNNSKVALISSSYGKQKIRIYRYDKEDGKWYKTLVEKYKKMLGN